MESTWLMFSMTGESDRVQQTLSDLQTVYRYLECGPVYWIAFFTQFFVVAIDPESVKVQ